MKLFDKWRMAASENRSVSQLLDEGLLLEAPQPLSRLELEREQINGRINIMIGVQTELEAEIAAKSDELSQVKTIIAGLDAYIAVMAEQKTFGVIPQNIDATREVDRA